MLLAYLKFAKKYYQTSTEYDNLKLAARPITELYGSLASSKFAATEYKAVRAWWLSDKTRSRQYVNKQMKRALRIIKWAVGEGLLPPENYTAIKCVDPLRKGRCDVRESEPVTCVEQVLVDATLPHMTSVLADMVRFQQIVGCRPGELVRITPAMVDRTGEVWTITLREHKTAHRGKTRIVYVGPQAQKVLAPYLLRAEHSPCFSPIESEQQRRQAAHEARKTPMSCGNRPGTNRIARKPRKAPSEGYTGTYARAIRYACGRAELPVWAPNQLRHNAATAVRKQYGIEAASVILGHSGIGVMGKLMNELQRLADETGTAVVCVHHGTKGDQSQKRSLDMLAGAGSFGRSLDASIAIRDHEQDGLSVLEFDSRTNAGREAISAKFDWPLTATSVSATILTVLMVRVVQIGNCRTPMFGEMRSAVAIRWSLLRKLPTNRNHAQYYVEAKTIHLLAVFPVDVDEAQSDDQGR